MAEAALRCRELLQLVFVYQDGLSHDVLPLVRLLYAITPDQARDRAAFAAFDARFRTWLDTAGHDSLPRLCQCRVPGRLFQYALVHGHLPLIAHLHASRRVHVNRTHWSLAAKYEQLTVLAYFFAKHCDGFHPDMMARAAYRGHFSVVRFLHEAGVRSNSAGALIWACEQGHLAIAEYLHMHGLGVWDPGAVARIARSGHLHILSFLRKHNYAGFSPIVFDIAASQGNLDLLGFFIEANVPGLGSRTLKTAARFGHAKTVSFLLAHVPSTCVDAACLLAAQHGHEDVVRLLGDSLTDESVQRAATLAMENGHVKVLTYLWTLRPHVADTTAALAAGTKRQHPAIVEYLQQRKRWRRP